MVKARLRHFRLKISTNKIARKLIRQIQVTVHFQIVSEEIQALQDNIKNFRKNRLELFKITSTMLRARCNQMPIIRHLEQLLMKL